MMITLLLLFTIGCGKVDTNSIGDTTYGYNKDTVESDIKSYKATLLNEDLDEEI